MKVEVCSLAIGSLIRTDRPPSCSQELKAACKEAGLPVTGKKEELIARLSQTAAAPAPIAVPPAAAVAADIVSPQTAAALEVVTQAAAAQEVNNSKHAKIVFAGKAVPEVSMAAWAIAA